MARISITEAAKQGFKSRSTLNKDVRSGKLPSHVERGRKVVDVADLIRLYGEPGGKEDRPVPTDLVTATAEQENYALKAQLTRAEADLAEARRQIDDQTQAASAEREKFMELIDNSQKQLQDMREDRERVEKRDQEIIAELRKPWLKRLFGR